MAKRKLLAILSVLILSGIAASLIFFTGGKNREKPQEISPTSTQTPIENSNRWFDLLNVTPYPFSNPLPEPEWTPIDGTYAKLDPDWPQWWACRRCADYRPAGGIWKLQFDRGILRIYYEVTGWRNIASYSVSNDRLTIFNDPICPTEVGEYRWASSGRSLELEVLDDSCSFQLRGENLGKQAWGSCQPPTDITAGSDHWHKPPGCWDYPLRALPETPKISDLNVEVISDFALNTENPPDVVADANTVDRETPEGITISLNDQSIPYGRSLVLWQGGYWVEAETDLPYRSMGVQFFGDSVIGWARVLFDGVEVWRGDTSVIYSYLGRNGGYIQISGFDPGHHTIRAEWLGVDTRPVTVAFFGFGE